MLLKQMRPGQLDRAVEEGWPLLVPAGCVEYHGPHLPLGTDTLIAEELCRRVAAVADVVVAPSFEYGATGYAVSGPEKGTVDIDNDAFGRYAKSVLQSLHATGLTRIGMVVHHQGNSGPLALALRRAAAELTFEVACEAHGEGWWGAHPRADAGASLRVLASILPAASHIARGDHAGMYETSFMLAAHPEMVDMQRLETEELPWFCTRPENPSEEATAELGERMFDAMVGALVAELDVWRR